MMLDLSPTTATGGRRSSGPSAPSRRRESPRPSPRSSRHGDYLAADGRGRAAAARGGPARGCSRSWTSGSAAPSRPRRPSRTGSRRPCARVVARARGPVFGRRSGSSAVAARRDARRPRQSEPAPRCPPTRSTTSASPSPRSTRRSTSTARSASTESHREEVACQKVRTAFLPVGESRIELLEPTSEDSPVAKFLAQRGAGIHHVCFAVDDLDAALAELSRGTGFRLIHRTPVPGAGGKRVAFLHPDAGHGVLIELSEKAAKAHESRRRSSCRPARQSRARSSGGSSETATGRASTRARPHARGIRGRGSARSRTGRPVTVSSRRRSSSRSTASSGSSWTRRPDDFVSSPTASSGRSARTRGYHLTPIPDGRRGRRSPVRRGRRSRSRTVASCRRELRLQTLAPGDLAARLVARRFSDGSSPRAVISAVDQAPARRCVRRHARSRAAPTSPEDVVRTIVDRRRATPAGIVRDCPTDDAGRRAASTARSEDRPSSVVRR